MELTSIDFEPATRTSDEIQSISRPSLSYWQDAWLRLKKNKQALFSLYLIIALILFTLAGPLLWQVDPGEQDLNRISQAPSLGETAVVIPDEDVNTSNEIGAANAGDAKDDRVVAVASDLTAPVNLRIVANPTTSGVKLQWDRVPGASAYVLYRNTSDPSADKDYGLPLGETLDASETSYDDKMNLEAKTYYYTVMATLNGEESGIPAFVKADVTQAITLSQALKLDPNTKEGATITLPSHPFGTDYLGRDLLARIMAGARVSLFIGFFAPLLYILFGVLLGCISGYYGGRVDLYIMRITDLVIALPFLLFMILFRIAFGVGAGESGIFPLLVALIALSWTCSARLVRGQVLQLREAEFVQAARLLGAKPFYLLVRHLIPNTMGVILVSLTFAIPSTIFTEAFLSFIGMGVVPPTPSWGSMCNDGIQTFLSHPHEFLFPAFFISVAVLAFNLLGDGLRDAMDPKLRSVE